MILSTKTKHLFVLILLEISTYVKQITEDDQILADIDKRLEELQTGLLKLVSSNADYEKVGDEIHRLREEKQKL